MNQGKLFVVATPIGNLNDITFRAIDTLKQVDFIICEDTRVSSALLNKYEIKNKLFVLNAGNEEKKLDLYIKYLLEGKSVALISDAGTPTISDPGGRLVNKAKKSGIEIYGIPGPNAAVLALSISGIATDSFVFEGFLPQKKGRQSKLKLLATEERTIVLYESMYRIEKLIDEIAEYMPNRYIQVYRELTKMFEESWEGYPSDIQKDLSNKTIKGEFVVLISPLKWKV
ncbi:MAG TPA: 16S rRNA (cytidine(1402)-2'-O)-methyltransferase [Melioribacteraceae bacterium]|nr:16S rRNA (cytidine(1402)-2'-O)-methyltransferase [Melioribacteraceae bacterium]